jgi:hypothetical protein
MVDLTIAICTNRDYENFLKPTIDMIYDFPNPKNISFEIIVYGPKHINLDNRINSFYEEKYKQGNLFGYNYLTWMSNGRNIAYLTDDMYFDDNFFEVCNFLDSIDKKIKVAGFTCNDVMFNPFPDKLITHNVGFNEDSVNVLLRSFGYINQIPMARFLAANKESLKDYMNGYIFHPLLFKGAGDIYLSIWAYTQGDRIYENIPVGIYNRIKASITEFDDKDAEKVSNLVDRLSLGYLEYV